MSYRWPFLATCLCIVSLIALPGCGSKDDGSNPTVSISEKTSPAPLPNNGQPQPPQSSETKVAIDTSYGIITVKLDADRVPQTVTNFLNYVDANHYQQTIIHQIYKGQGFLAGGYGADLAQRRERTPIFNEARYGRKNQRGTIAMVRQPDSIDSATCQFFINVVDNPMLDHRDNTPEGYGYCVFGEVVDGMDVVLRIANSPVHDTPEFESTPIDRIVVKSIRRVR